MYMHLAKKNFLPTLLFLLLPSAGAFAQIGAISPDYSDTTKYWAFTPSPADTTAYRPLSSRQDTVFVFFNRPGKLTAAQPQGRPARFTWQKLDTASLTFQTIWVDTVPVERIEKDFFTTTERDSSKCDSFPRQAIYAAGRATSELPDSVGFGCYRVVTDTLQTLYDTVRCDSLYMVHKAADGSDSGGHYIENVNILVAKGVQLVAADTFRAWVFVDSFRIDSIAIVSHDCDFLNLQAIFYPASEGYYSYSYVDLWRTPRKEMRSYPDCYDCYIKGVAWTTTPDDIHKGADIDANDTWKRSYMAYIPTPLYDAKYRVTVENYFGAKDTLETGTIEAKSTYAQMKLYVEKTDKDGVKKWEEKASMEDPEQSVANVYLANTSINAGDSTFTWVFFSNLYEQEDTSVIPPPLWQTVTTDSAEAVYPPEPYKPGRYLMTLTVVNRHGCTDSDSITLEVEEFLIEPDAIPLLFTPNGDGKNDTYQLKDPDSKVHSVEAIEVSIFNRYGQLVFHSRSVLFAWDGKLRGANSLAPDGVYFYVVKAQGYSKQRRKIRQTLKGNIHLLGGK
jgi:gliding motility-associated-like protein